jgi:hypothetical protein
MYFDLGCYLSRRVLNSKEFKDVSEWDQARCRRDWKEWFDDKCQDLITRGAMLTSAFRKRLILLADQARVNQQPLVVRFILKNPY